MTTIDEKTKVPLSIVLTSTGTIVATLIALLTMWYGMTGKQDVFAATVTAKFESQGEKIKDNTNDIEKMSSLSLAVGRIEAKVDALEGHVDRIGKFVQTLTLHK